MNLVHVWGVPSEFVGLVTKEAIMLGICKFLMNDGYQGTMMKVPSAIAFGAEMLVATMKWCRDCDRRPSPVIVIIQPLNLRLSAIFAQHIVNCLPVCFLDILRVKVRAAHNV
jgi:hypothetical protein